MYQDFKKIFTTNISTDIKISQQQINNSGLERAGVRPRMLTKLGILGISNMNGIGCVWHFNNKLSWRNEY